MIATPASLSPQPSTHDPPLAPTVTLLRDQSSAAPFALAVAAAWSCYGAKPAKVENVLKLVHGP